MSADSFTINLTTVPPSVNGAYLNIPGKGRIKAKSLRAWLRDAGWECRMQAKGKIEGAVTVDISCGRTSKRRDIDNVIKGLCDLLVSLDLIDDDSNVQEVRARWRMAPGTTIIVTRYAEAALAAAE